MNITTKDKGDTGVIQTINYLNNFNIKTALPISEHLPFDIIAINNNGKLSRVSVKYIQLNKNGVIMIPLKTVGVNCSKIKVKHVDLNWIDAFAVYCPNNNQCYFVHKKFLLNVKSYFSLRELPVNINCKNTTTVRFAKDFINPNCIFD